MGHTKGTWKIKDMDFDGNIIIGVSESAQTDWICEVNGGESNGSFAAIPSDEGKANALLIAKAPQLLEIVEQALKSNWLSPTWNKFAKEVIRDIEKVDSVSAKS